MSEPDWLRIARSYLGVREIKGVTHNPTITGWLKRLKYWWSDDETPWCGTFCAAVLDEAEIQPPKSAFRALAWAEWGERLAIPIKGCIVVFKRQGGGHVGFVVGTDQHGRLQVLGGNQNDQVSIAPFLRERAIAYRWPSGIPYEYAPLPLIQSQAASSVNEA